MMQEKLKKIREEALRRLSEAASAEAVSEIRLAYLYDENGRRPVSGGSVSGSMKQLVSHMTLSKEMRQYDNVRIPSVTRLDGVTVTGK